MTRKRKKKSDTPKIISLTFNPSNPKNSLIEPQITFHNKNPTFQINRYIPKVETENHTNPLRKFKKLKILQNESC